MAVLLGLDPSFEDVVVTAFRFLGVSFASLELVSLSLLSVAGIFYCNRKISLLSHFEKKGHNIKAIVHL